jgi:hypothetical protein
MTEADTIAQGVAAWQGLHDHGRRSWDQWLLVARALAALRANAMAAGRANRPMGLMYNRIFGGFLREHGFDGIDNQQRYRALLCLENLPAIEQWRATLSEKERERLNHPGAVWHAWRRAVAEPPLPRRAPAKGAQPHGGGKPVFWNGEAIRRAAIAIRESYSTDTMVMARRALEAAIRSEDDLAELLDGRRSQARRGNGAAAQVAA